MKRVLGVIRTSFGLLAACGIVFLWLGSLKAGREATVWSLANMVPGSARVTAAGIMNTLSAPVRWVEQGLDWRFGGRSSLADAVACIGGKPDNRRSTQTCIREEQRYLPLPKIDRNNILIWREGQPCSIQLESAEPERFLPTQLDVYLTVEASAKHVFAAAVSTNLRPDVLLVYQLDQDGCDFVRRNSDAYEWRILSMQGFSNDLQEAQP